MTTTTSDPAPQQDSTDDTAPAPNPSTSTDVDETPTGDADNQDDDTDTDDQDDGKGNREAKRYRLKLRETERECATLRDTLTRTRQAIVDTAVNAAGLDPRLLAAAGHTLDTLVGDDGLIDAAKLSEAISSAAQEFNIAAKGRPPKPNFQQGSAGGQPRSTATWANALKRS
jgi:hypothetical protein